MSRSFRTLLVLALAIGLLLGLGSFSKTEAVKIFGDADGNYTNEEFPLSNCGGSCSYLGAYEYYGNQKVVAGIGNYNPYSGSEEPVITIFQPGMNYNNGTAIAIRLKNGKFINPDYVTNGTSYCLVNPASNSVVATQVSTGYPTDTINFVTTTSLSKDTKYMLGICGANNNYIQPNERVEINSGLNANCDNEVKVQIEWVSGNDCCTADLIKIKPKHKQKLALNFTAELDSDKDFKTFLGGKTKQDLCCTSGSTCNCGSSICFTNGTSSNNTGCPYSSDVYVLGNPFSKNDTVVRVSFKITSENSEPGIDKIYATNSNLKCTSSDDNKTWTCSSDCIPCPECSDNFKMYVELKGTVENVPTLWKLANSSIEEYCYPDARVKAMCCSVTEGEAGSWYGGVEAIIPFVKIDDTAQAYTYVKLFNRYSKKADVFAEVFNKNSNSIIIALNKIATIDAQGAITLAADDFKNLCPTCDWSYGQAVKLLIRVPSQTGCLSGSCYNNPYDPYIQGIVVSTYGQAQRSVPLLFKAFKQGQYNQ